MSTITNLEEHSVELQDRISELLWEAEENKEAFPRTDKDIVGKVFGELYENHKDEIGSPEYFVEWLYGNYWPKLKKYEIDILKSIIKSYRTEFEFGDYTILETLKGMGYFKGVCDDMNIGGLIKRCEVEDNE